MRIVVSRQLRDLANRSKEFIPIVLGVIAVVSIIAVITWALWPKTLSARVDTIGWFYSVELQERTVSHDSGWGKPWSKEVVSGSMKCDSKYYGMKDCMCHTDYYTTGYGEHKTRHSKRVCSRCPDYRDWCEYDHITWPKKKEWSSAGNTFATNWPEVPEAKENQRLVRHEFYNVIFVDPKDNEKYTLHPASLSIFKTYPRGSRWMIKVFVNNSVDVLGEAE